MARPSKNLTPDRVSSEAGFYSIAIVPAGPTAHEDSQKDAQKEESPSPCRQTPQASVKPSTIRRLVLDSWICEAVALSVSIGCLIAIAITVRIYDDEPIPQLPSGLTLNTIVSVLSTAARSGLVFAVSASLGQLKWAWMKGKSRRIQDFQLMDDASKGPLVAIGLLLSWTGGLLAALGCVITISILTFGPFLQQLLEYPPRETRQLSTEAIASRNRAYNASLIDGWDYSRALETGLWSTPKAFDTIPSCPTGRCSWDKFKSIGWCSKCETWDDLANPRNCKPINIMQNTTREPRLRVLEFGNGDSITLMNAPRNETYGNETTTDDWGLYFNATGEAIWPIHYSAQKYIWIQDPGEALSLKYPQSPYYGKNVSFLGVREPLLVFGHVKLTLDPSVRSRMPISDHDVLHVEEASRCILTVCEKELSISKEGGTTNWTEHSTNYGHLFGLVLMYDGTPTFRGNVSHACWKPDEPVQSDLIMANATFHTIHETDPKSLPFCDLDSISHEIGERLTANWNFTYAISPNEHNVLSYMAFAGRYYEGDEETVGRGSTRSLNERMESIAIALTNYGLQTSNDTVHGYAISTETYVRVRWRWIVLPALLELGSLVLLILTIAHNRRKRVPTWKSSILAVIYHQVEGLDGRATGTTERLSGMEASAKNAAVQLSSNQDGITVMSGRSTSRSFD